MKAVCQSTFLPLIGADRSGESMRELWKTCLHYVGCLRFLSSASERLAPVEESIFLHKYRLKLRKRAVTHGKTSRFRIVDKLLFAVKRSRIMRPSYEKVGRETSAHI